MNFPHAARSPHGGETAQTQTRGTMRAVRWAFTVCSAVQCVLAANLRALNDVKDAIVLGKSEDIAVIGLFNAISSTERNTFKSIAKGFPDNSGFALAGSLENSGPHHYPFYHHRC